MDMPDPSPDINPDINADINPGQVKACCAAAYGSDLVALLLGDSYHPGGLALTRHLADLLLLEHGQRVLDVASGRGTTALLLAGEYGVEVEGVDLAAANVSLATGSVEAAGLGDRVRFRAADAERLPYDDESLDAVVCECAFCTFPDKPTAAAELARVLRPGGRVGITDVTIDPAQHRGELPTELTSLRAWVACIADARPLHGDRNSYADLLRGAGLRVTYTQRQDQAMCRMLDQIEARLALIRMTAKARAEALGLDLDQAPHVLAVARQAVADSVLGYGLLIAQKPNRNANRKSPKQTRTMPRAWS